MKKVSIISMLTLFAAFGQIFSLSLFKNKFSFSMSTVSIIAIKGNHFDKAVEIFESFRYVDLKNDKQFHSWINCAEFLSDNYLGYTKKDIALRGLWFDNGWTIIFDPEMVDFIEDSAMSSISRKLNTEVYTFIIQTTSGTYGFAKYNQHKQRNFLSIDGEVAETFGIPIAEEHGLNITPKISSDDIVRLANKLGIDIEIRDTGQTFIVKELAYNNDLKKELEKFKH